VYYRKLSSSCGCLKVLSVVFFFHFIAALRTQESVSEKAGMHAIWKQGN
jgi:hypothetical protein